MKQPIRIMQIVYSLRMGGLEKLVLDLVRNLDRSKYIPIVCSLSNDGELARELSQEGIDYFLMNKKEGIDYPLHFRLAKLLRQQKIDLVHTHNRAPFFYGTVAAKVARIPAIVHTEHSKLDRKGKRIDLTTKFLSRRIDIVVADCQDVANNLSLRGIPKNKIRTIFNGIDIDKFSRPNNVSAKKRELGLEEDCLVVGNIARLVPVKDHLNLLRAFKIVSETLPQTRLVIVGDGVLKQKLEDQAKRMKLDSRIKFLGMRNDIAEILNTFDVFVLSSESEGLSLTLLEAMAAAKPVVATRAGGNLEVIEDNLTGCLVPPGDARKMAEALLNVVSNKKLAEDLGRMGYKRVVEKFCLGRMIRDYENLYESLLGRLK